MLLSEQAMGNPHGDGPYRRPISGEHHLVGDPWLNGLGLVGTLGY